MKNLTTKEFCRKFYACKEGTRFALRYNTMRDCYAALLAVEAGDNSIEWAIWTATRPGVMQYRDLRMFSVKCARRVQHLMTDERSVAALDVAELYVNGEANTAELASAYSATAAVMAEARDAAWADMAAHDAVWAVADVVDDAARTALWAVMAAARNAAWAAMAARDASWSDMDAALAAERREQLAILGEFGNPFEEAK